MRKMFVLQKVMFVLFILLMVASFIYTLGFMTDYKDFQYLFKPVNQPLYEFHHEVLIPFNNTIFYISVIGVIMIIVVFIAKLNKLLPSAVNLCLGVIANIPLILTSIYSLSKLNGIKAEYNGLDFSNVQSETYSEYIPTTLAFDLGNTLYLIGIIFSILFIVVMVINFLIRRSKLKCLN